MGSLGRSWGWKRRLIWLRLLFLPAIHYALCDATCRMFSKPALAPGRWIWTMMYVHFLYILHCVCAHVQGSSCALHKIKSLHSLHLWIKQCFIVVHFLTVFILESYHKECLWIIHMPKVNKRIKILKSTFLIFFSPHFTRAKQSLAM